MHMPIHCVCMCVCARVHMHMPTCACVYVHVRACVCVSIHAVCIHLTPPPPCPHQRLYLVSAHLESSRYRPNDRVSQMRCALHRLQAVSTSGQARTGWGRDLQPTLKDLLYFYYLLECNICFFYLQEFTL